jgi:acyl-CoA synthetase (AMP-forming)/AMP-acid ligase II
VVNPVPIGRVCSGDRGRLVSPDGLDVSHGEEGELLIAGGSVMLGYWNLPERNAQAFHQDETGRWYRTGDIVYQDDDGEYVFVGRRDRMVKKRGFRVELGEIEAALYRHPSIGEAAVLAGTSNDGEVVIRAILTWSGDTPPSMIKLKQFCSQQVPLYMVPDRFSVVPELPKTSTDKIDYQRLKELA